MSVQAFAQMESMTFSQIMKTMRIVFIIAAVVVSVSQFCAREAAKKRCQEPVNVELFNRDLPSLSFDQNSLFNND